MLDNLNALPAGYVLQEYRIESMLGAGGFGLTYLAHDCNLNTKVAVKEYLPADFASRIEDQSVQPKGASMQQSFEWGLQRFLDESRTLALLRHPNIVRVMRFFEANHTAYMVMEFVAGRPLGEWAKERDTNEQGSILGITLPLLHGLEVIHQAGYLHRDIKPSNIFIRDDGSPVLIDFGSARMKVNPDQNLTAIVTPGFSPLEQYYDDGKQGPWTDIYSFAGVLYWLVTGRKPVEAAARVQGNIMPSALNSGDRGSYSTEFLAAIDWGLRTHEQDRPQSVAEWRAALGSRRSDALPKRRASDLHDLSAAAIAARGRTAVTTAVHRPLVEPAAVASIPADIAFDRDTLKRFEIELAKHVGPIAGVMVRHAAKKARTAPELAALLAPEIADRTARATYVRRLSSENSIPPSQPALNIQADSSATHSSGKPSTTNIHGFGDHTLRRAETALAQYIGAVAKVVVRRAANKARNESELYMLLAEEIEDKAERKKFMDATISISHRP